jgi:lysophospholipid acyltransferase (LPLAT)-like uncharacterized protein
VFLPVPLGANCHTAIVERRKWDAAPNPLPFGKVAVVYGPARTIESLSDLETIEENCLQSALKDLSRETRPGIMLKKASVMFM